VEKKQDGNGEEKYVKIDAQVFEVLPGIQIRREDLQVFLFVLRKTSGWAKESDWIAARQFRERTGLINASIYRALRRLEAMNMLIKTDSREVIRGKHRKLYTPELDWRKWRALDGKGQPTGNKLVTRVFPETRKGDPRTSGSGDTPLVAQELLSGSSGDTRTSSPGDTPLVAQERITNELNTKENHKGTDTKGNGVAEKVRLGWFEDLWKEYPKNKDGARKGKKKAKVHFLASVKTEEDLGLIRKALTNYKNTQTVKDGYVFNGSTWFDDWREDWLDVQKPKGDKDWDCGNFDD